MAKLELRGVVKRFGDSPAPALDGVSLDVEEGEFLTLLGGSGCGKSTTLRIVAGLTDADAGDVLLDGRSIADVPAHKRGMAMVFQSYALFPHLTVAQNVAFGLEMRRLSARDVAVKVERALDLVAMGELGKRYPRQLSGGQQQRVALARALVVEPHLLLLDEPLSNLDAQLRARLRLELRALQQKLGVTTIYVTHDQAEALALSDRIAFMAAGKIVEIGAPEAVYRRPQSRATAEFLGAANLIDGAVAEVNGVSFTIDSKLGRLEFLRQGELGPGDRVEICLRPEEIGIVAPDADEGLPATVRHAAYQGSTTEYIVDPVGIDLPLQVQVSGPSAWRIGDTVRVRLPRASAVLTRGGG
ncbi:MAG TPA: ABC transporter ATP-binding protein [Candidatus Cybelea sp.]|nr:ABC transporter ATP-binding protein [Candidatus Cybelea sp.]